jgi:hypothetical protein
MRANSEIDAAKGAAYQGEIRVGRNHLLAVGTWVRLLHSGSIA